MLIIAGMTAMTLAGCQRQDEVADVPEPAPVPAPEPAYVVADLALALPDISPSSAGTRMASKVVQDGSSRPVIILSITPFEKEDVILSADRPSYVDGWTDDYEYYPKDDGTRRFHYMKTMSFMHGVASMLTYAKAQPLGDESNNGSLIVKVDGTEVDYIPRLETPGSLSFDLEPIYDIDSKGVPDHARLIADYLTSIANSEVSVGVEPSTETLRWKDTDGVLKGLYNGFINMGNDARPGLIAGSAANVIPFVNALYEDIDETLASENISLTGIQRDLCGAIKAKIHDVTYVTLSENKVSTLGDADNYPHELGLPDGAAVLVWNTEDADFDVVTQTTTTSNITGMGRYAYPPELYYYGNSLIKTSNEEVDSSTIYKNTSTWTKVLEKYPNSKVSGNTKAVAIIDPLQYGVARLKAKVNQTASSLKDSDGNNVEVGTDKFPITGIIVSGQFPVGYDFKVLNVGTLSGDESIEHFVYDRHVVDKEGATIYLSSATSTAEFNTLLLQSKDYNVNKPEESDITVILEFENKSQDFKGENKMIVYKDTKFYLVGKLKLEDVTRDDDYVQLDADTKSRVFTQDHTTDVTMTINSLAHAYNVMPNILSGRLEVSVEMKLKWTEATPTTVILK